MILGHHGGELSLVSAALASAGSAPLLLLLFREQVARLGKRLGRRPGGRRRTRV
jgi:hypothetical protein